MWSIFLSHTSVDKPFCRELSRSLRAHGIETWLDEAELQVGDSLIKKIEIGIHESTYLGVILSPESVQSSWVQKELEIALNQEINGRRVKVLPILFKHCSIPGFLTGKLYADFTSDFSKGLKTILDRFESDLMGVDYRQRRAWKALQTRYQDWLTTGETKNFLEESLLDNLITGIDPLSLSDRVLKFIFISMSHLTGSKNPRLEWSAWFNSLDDRKANDLFASALSNSSTTVRLGALALVIPWKSSVVPAIEKQLAKENDTETRRRLSYFLRCRGKFTAELERKLRTDPDWVVKMNALVGVARLAIAFTDKSEFSSGLIEIMRITGYDVVEISGLRFAVADELVDYDVLSGCQLVVVVSGEHAASNNVVDAEICRYVERGGRLFATCWASWENTAHGELTTILPFSHQSRGYRENVILTCKATSCSLAQRLFPSTMTFPASHESLEIRDGSELLCQTLAGLPIFGFRSVGNGTCYYLNVCQHTCIGHMPSPLSVDREFAASLRRVFEWIIDRPLED
jgi:hypothetical protein